MDTQNKVTLMEKQKKELPKFYPTKATYHAWRIFPQELLLMNNILCGMIFFFRFLRLKKHLVDHKLAPNSLPVGALFKPRSYPMQYNIAMNTIESFLTAELFPEVTITEWKNRFKLSKCAWRNIFESKYENYLKSINRQSKKE
jgi:hypothetical protein